MNTRSVQRALNSIMGQGPHPPTAEGMTNGLHEPAMRIGREFQAEVPPLSDIHSTSDPTLNSQGSGSILVWTPTCDLKDEDLEGYLKVAKEQFGYGVEQALGLLYWHKYNIEKAVEDLPNFCPVQDEWTMEDKVTFEQAFQFHGKNFQRIRTMLPDKPISSLVKYYYLWKRSYSQYSLMDKHAKKNGRRIFAGLPVNNDDTDSTQSGSSPSEAAPFTQPTTILLSSKGKQLPKGIHLRTGELVALASDVEHAQIKQLDKEALTLKEQIQEYKQVLVSSRVSGEGIEHLRPTEYTRKTGGSVPTRWTEEEIDIAIEVIRKHGKSYEALANALEGKTIAQCRNFFTNYKRKLNLPRIIAEYEIRHGRKHSRYSRQAGENMAERGDPNSSMGVMGGEGRGGGAEVDFQGISITTVPGHIENFAQEPHHKRMRLATDGLEYSE